MEPGIILSLSSKLSALEEGTDWSASLPGECSNVYGRIPSKPIIIKYGNVNQSTPFVFKYDTNHFRKGGLK